MNIAKRSFTLFLFLVLLVSHAASVNAALTVTTSNVDGGLGFVGLGETMPGNNIGSLRVTYGVNNCNFSGGATTCVLTGDYTEDAVSTHTPGATGSFILTQNFTGTLSPIIRTAIAPGSNDFANLSFENNGMGLNSTLSLNDSNGFSGIFDLTSGEFGNGFFISAVQVGNSTCTGLPMNGPCISLNDIGNTPGSTLTTPSLNSFTYGFLVTDEALASAVPIPAAVWLFGSTLIGLLSFRKK